MMHSVWRAAYLLLGTTALGPFGARKDTLPSAAHPIHMTSTQIELSKDQRTFSITMRIFTDDFEAVISPSIQRPIQIANTNTTTVDSLITFYLATRLQVSVNDGPMIPVRVLHHRIEGNATVVTAMLVVNTVPKKLSVMQRVMLERFDDQNNVLRITMGSQKRSALTRRGVERADLSF